jgi:serine/threonine protein phosphatase PrpC
MSRAFGDFILKDHGVIAIPDIFYHPLTSSDQFIVLASDGVSAIIFCIQQFNFFSYKILNK